MTEQVKQILAKARELISDKAVWGQGNGGKLGEHCMTTAIDFLGDYFSREQRDTAVGHLAEIIGGQPDQLPRRTIWEFNDAKGRSHGEVLAVFDKAIAACSMADHQSAAASSEAVSNADGPQ